MVFGGRRESYLGILDPLFVCEKCLDVRQNINTLKSYEMPRLETKA